MSEALRVDLQLQPSDRAVVVFSVIPVRLDVLPVITVML